MLNDFKCPNCKGTKTVSQWNGLYDLTGRKQMGLAPCPTCKESGRVHLAVRENLSGCDYLQVDGVCSASDEHNCDAYDGTDGYCRTRVLTDHEVQYMTDFVKVNDDSISRIHAMGKKYKLIAKGRVDDGN